MKAVTKLARRVQATLEEAREPVSTDIFGGAIVDSGQCIQPGLTPLRKSESVSFPKDTEEYS